MLLFSVPLWRKINVYHERKQNKAKQQTNKTEKEQVQSKLQTSLKETKPCATSIQARHSRSCYAETQGPDTLGHLPAEATVPAVKGDTS